MGSLPWAIRRKIECGRHNPSKNPSARDRKHAVAIFKELIAQLVLKMLRSEFFLLRHPRVLAPNLMGKHVIRDMLSAQELGGAPRRVGGT